MKLRTYLQKGTILLDMEAETLEDIIDLLLERLINNDEISYENMKDIKHLMLQKHRHQFEGLKKTKSEAVLRRGNSSMGFETGFILNAVRSFSDIHSFADLKRQQEEATKNGLDKSEVATNSNFMRKIPKGAEASNIMIGEVDFLNKPLSAFIRLQKAVKLGDLTEVALPTRFIFILIGPPVDPNSTDCYKEIGRSIGTSLSDEVFHEVAYRARKKEHIIMGLDEFLDSVTVLPPGEWDRNIRIEPPTSVPSQEGRKVITKVLSSSGLFQKIPDEIDEEEEKYNLRKEAGLTRSGRFCGGLINDIKRKKQSFFSDFKDAVSVQSIAVIFFLYFACLAPTIAFGGILGQVTKNRMASIESLVSGLTAGVVFALFSGQPLTILGLTGPDLVFETLVFDFCEGQNWDYLSFRLWIGVWVAIILIILVVTDASSFVCYITRFTEESFATLIAVIFIKKSLENVARIATTHPYNPSPCFCSPLVTWPGWDSTASEAFSVLNKTEIEDTLSIYNVSSLASKCSFDFTFNNYTETVYGFTTPGCSYAPNAFFMSIILFLGTFLVATYLKNFKDFNLFPAVVRSYISDFAVITAILLMVVVDLAFGIATPKLVVPDTFSPTWSGRGWLIPPFGVNPWWSVLVAPIPAALGSILIFMDQHITAVIVNRKENKMKKGGGYHLDLLILAFTIVVNSILGIPWYVASTILSITHVKSLQMESETAAPGESRKFLGIREQRLTAIIVFLLVGLSAFMTKLLGYIPMPVLYGVFLYMGINSLNGIQMFDRLLLFMMPKKYQPDYSYLRKLPLSRVHFFTLIQIICFVVLWLIQEFKSVSILFPIMLVVIIGIRKLLDYVFTQYEMTVGLFELIASLPSNDVAIFSTQIEA